MTTAVAIARRAAHPLTGSAMNLPGADGKKAGFHAFVAACPISRKLIGPEVLRLNYKTSVNILAAATILMDDKGNGHATSVLYPVADPALPSICALWNGVFSPQERPGDETDILWVGEEPTRDVALTFTLQFALCRGEQSGEAHLDAMASHLCDEIFTLIDQADRAIWEEVPEERPVLHIHLDRAGCVEVLCDGFASRFAAHFEHRFASWSERYQPGGFENILLVPGWVGQGAQAA